MYWMRQVRPVCVTGPPSVSRSPWSTARRTSESCRGSSPERTSSRIGCRPGRAPASVLVTGFAILVPPRPPARMPEHVVEPAFVRQLDPVEAHLQRQRELRIGGREGGRRRRRDASVAEQESEGIGVHRHLLRLELGGSGEEREFESVQVRPPKPPDHLLRLEHSCRLAAPLVLGRWTAHRCSPQHTVDAPSWARTRKTSFRPWGYTPSTGVGSPSDPMTRSPTASSPMGRESRRGQDLARVRLRPSTHECQRARPRPCRAPSVASASAPVISKSAS